MTGTVIDAETSEPVKDAFVFLYIDHQDSIVYQEKPFYFATTDEGGTYRINNLRPDTFKVVALLDNNLDFFFDSQSEYIGYIDSLIILDDTLKSGIDLQIFKETGPSSYRSYEVDEQGKAKLEFLGPVQGDEIRVLDSVEHVITYDEGSTILYLWYLPSSRRSLRYEVLRNSMLDTVSLRVNTRTTDTLENVRIRSLSSSPNVGLHPALPLVITFDRPIRSVDTSFISIVDTLNAISVKPNISISEDAPDEVIIDTPWEGDAEFIMELYPGAITDFFGKTHDTISRNFFVAQETDFGSIEVMLIDTDSIQYAITLIKGDKRLKTLIWNTASSQDNLSFEKLEPAVYELEVVFDIIPNGIWDPGSYLEHRQSEEKYTITLPDLRANWVHEENIDIKRLPLKEVKLETSQVEEQDEN